MKKGTSNLNFEMKYIKYKNLIYRISYTYLKNQADCEDIIQDVFYKLFTKSIAFENEEHEKRWIIRVTVNLCKNNLKTYWNRKKTSLDEIDATINIEEKEVLEEVLNLPTKYKVSVYLYYVEGYKCKEISEILHLKESTVKMRLKKGRELLKLQIIL